MKKILYSIFAFIIASNFTYGQIPTDDAGHRTMMNTYTIKLNNILTANCPYGKTVDQYKKDIVNGFVSLPSAAKDSITKAAIPLKMYGDYFAATKVSNYTASDAYKYFYSSFPPSTVIHGDRLVESTTTPGLTANEMWDCALSSFSTGDCSMSAVTFDTKYIPSCAIAATKFLSKRAGNTGILVMIGGFSDCVNSFKLPEITKVQIEEVINTNPEIIASLNTLIDQTEYTIDSTSVVKMTKFNGNLNYTFTVIPNPTDTFFQNLIIEKRNDGQINNFLAEYELNTQIQQIVNDSIGNYIVNKKVFPITELPSTYARVSPRGLPFWDCLEVGYYVDTDVTHIGTHDNGYVVTYAQTFVLMASACSLVYRDYGPDTHQYNGCCGGGGAGGGSFYVPSLPSAAYNFALVLNTSEKLWWDAPANQPTVFQIKKYLNSYGDYSFAKQFITQSINNPALKLDFDLSVKSPYNIDKSTITNATPEGVKFNSVYEALTRSPEFKKLFLDIFDNNARFNVKFQIADHVYEDDDPTKKEVNANTKPAGTSNFVITISKQILADNTTMSKTKIEIAKTILHECIHAYLFVKANNPNLGMDIEGILNTMYPTYNEQHEFMYDHMIPVMTKVLSEIRDSVTTPAGRAILETSYTMHPTQNPLTSTPWIWNEYYYHLSLSGLDKTNCFIQDFPISSDALRLHSDYVNYGHNELNN